MYHFGLTRIYFLPCTIVICSGEKNIIEMKKSKQNTNTNSGIPVSEGLFNYTLPTNKIIPTKAMTKLSLLEFSTKVIV